MIAKGTSTLDGSGAKYLPLTIFLYPFLPILAMLACHREHSKKSMEYYTQDTQGAAYARLETLGVGILSHEFPNRDHPQKH